jgi:hypothetical protein
MTALLCLFVGSVLGGLIYGAFVLPLLFSGH